MKYIWLLVALLSVTMVWNAVTDIQLAHAGPKKDARYWYLKYHKEKKKNAKLWGQVKRYKLVATKGDPLTRSIVPWVGLAWCESGHRWGYNGGSGFDGGIQFHPSTWRGYGGTVFAPTADKATPVQQVAIGQLVLRKQGRGAWPACSRKGAW